jgi:hypothetical protein
MKDVKFTDGSNRLGVIVMVLNAAYKPVLVWSRCRARTISIAGGLATESRFNSLQRFSPFGHGG